MDSSEVTVEVLPTERKVRVTVYRQGLPTWFARILGIDETRFEVALFDDATIASIHAESVAWVAERRDVLSGVFYIAAVLC